MRIFTFFTLIFLVLTTNLKPVKPQPPPEGLIKAVTAFNVYADLCGQNTLKFLPSEETENVFCDISPTWPNGKKKDGKQFQEEILFHIERFKKKELQPQILRAPNNVWIYSEKKDLQRFSFNNNNILCIDGFPLHQIFTDPWYNLASFPGREISLKFLVNDIIQIYYYDWGTKKKQFQFINVRKKRIYQTLNEAD